MKATKMTVTWEEKVKCRETVTVRWEEVMDHLHIPEEDREGYEVSDEEVMDYLFDDDVQLLEHSFTNEIDYDLLDSDCSDVSVVEVGPRVGHNAAFDFGQLELATAADSTDVE